MRNKPFALTDSAKLLKTPYLSAEQFKQTLLGLNDSEMPGFLRTFVEEGVPFLFSAQPMIWEALRETLASRLTIPANHIAVIGSARLGFTVKPDEFGRSLSEKSDIDLSIICPILFENCKKDALKFSTEVQFKKIEPRNNQEKIYWDENAETLQRNIRSGFVDTKLIPNFHDRYPKSSEVNDAASFVHSRLGPSGISIRNVNARIFQTWEQFVNRVLTNYKHIKKNLSNR